MSSLRLAQIRMGYTWWGALPGSGVIGRPSLRKGGSLKDSMMGGGILSTAFCISSCPVVRAGPWHRTKYLTPGVCGSLWGRRGGLFYRRGRELERGLQTMLLAHKPGALPAAPTRECLWCFRRDAPGFEPHCLGDCEQVSKTHFSSVFSSFPSPHPIAS